MRWIKAYSREGVSLVCFVEIRLREAETIVVAQPSICVEYVEDSLGAI